MVVAAGVHWGEDEAGAGVEDRAGAGVEVGEYV